MPSITSIVYFSQYFQNFPQIEMKNNKQINGKSKYTHRTRPTSIYNQRNIMNIEYLENKFIPRKFIPKIRLAKWNCRNEKHFPISASSFYFRHFALFPSKLFYLMFWYRLLSLIFLCLTQSLRKQILNIVKRQFSTFVPLKYNKRWSESDAM